MTNAERIRRMSNQELAEFLCAFRTIGDGKCGGCPAEKFCCYPLKIGMKEYIVQEELFAGE